MRDVRRCAWATSDPLYIAYHDTEWGVPIRDPHRLFELLCLEGAQAGLSWITILRKRDGYRAAFGGFDPTRIAAYTDADRDRLMADAGIVRNRAKIAAFIGNAQAWLELDLAPERRRWHAAC
jgi:DNA-3-methyladenine glycosylase I